MGEETTWGDRMLQTGIDCGGYRNENLYGSLDGLNRIYLHGLNPRVRLVDGVSTCTCKPNSVHHMYL